MPSITPNYVRISSLSSWTHFFHPHTGIFRLPSVEGRDIDHLDIDLRFVDNELSSSLPEVGKEIYLPNVFKVTLRGGEYVQDFDERMDLLAEVLVALRPLEVHWLNAFDHPAEQQTLSTVLVHPAIIAAGELWQMEGSLRKLVIQGGFPTANLTAPTPYSQTPAASPLPSPGLRATFGSTLPSLSTFKPRPVDPAKLQERAERRRLADYSLKPRFSFAFGTWGAMEIRWLFDGRYTKAGITAIMSRLLSSLDQTYPYQSSQIDVSLPSLLTFSPVPFEIIEEIRPNTPSSLADYLSASAFVSPSPSTPGTDMQFARLWDSLSSADEDDEDDRESQSTRFKAEMLLLSRGNSSIITVDEMYPTVPPVLGGSSGLENRMGGLSVEVTKGLGKSPVPSFASMIQDTESDLEENEAHTPPLGSSIHIAGLGIATETKKASMGENERRVMITENAY